MDYNINQKYSLMKYILMNLNIGNKLQKILFLEIWCDTLEGP